MTKLRVLMLCPYVPEPLQHGGRMRSRMFANTLARLGDVCLTVPVQPDAAGDGHPQDTMAHAEALAAAFSGRVVPLPVEGAAASNASRKLRAWLRGRPDLLERRWSQKAKDVVRSLLEEHRFDAVFADSSFVLPLLPSADPTPLVLNLHNVESHLLLRPDEVPRRLVERWTRRVEARLLARAECAAARRATLTLAISALDAERLRALEPNAARVEVLENSVDAAAIEPLPWPPAGPSEPLLLYVGGYDYGPNREAAEALVLEHLPHLRREWPDLRVRLIGRDHNGTIARLVSGCDRVEALGRVADLRPHYDEATAVYLPIRTGGGTRGKILEAFAFGRPVIASTLGAEGFAISNRAEYLRADTPEEGVAALRTVQTGTGQEIVDRARAFLLSRHTHEAVATRLEKLMLEYVPSPS